MTLPRLAMFGCVLLLSACGSAPVRHYTLVPSAATVATPRADSLQLQVLPVRIPLQIDQPALVIRESDGRLAIIDTARWAAPPADEFHDALALALEQRLGVRDLAGLPRRNDLPLLSVRTDVRRFESLLDNAVTLDVVWSLARSNDHGASRSMTCSSTLEQPAGSGIEGLVLAHQVAIARLADEMTTALNNGHACP